MKRIAVFTSGGDSPGMNACVRGVVRTCLTRGVVPVGIRRGYQGMIENDFYDMKSSSVSNIIQQGGTILKTARSQDFRNEEGRHKAYENLKEAGIDGVVACGGDGTFTGADIFLKEHEDLAFIGTPGTIDNDLYGTDATIGFDTAVNTAMQAIDKIRDTAQSHDRIFLIEVMGRHAGFIALMTAIGGGAEVLMVPETITTIDDVVAIFEKSYDKRKSSSIGIVAEGDEEGNALEIAKKVRHQMQSKGRDIDMRVSILGHMQRGGSPTAQDRVLGSRLGIAATEALLNGESGKMAGILNDKVHLTPFQEAITKKKQLNPELLNAVAVLSF